MTTPKTYHIRLLNKKRPFMERFMFSNDKVSGTQSDQISVTVRKTSVTPIPGRKAPPKLNTWQTNTWALLDKYRDKTKDEILKMQIF